MWISSRTPETERRKTTHLYSWIQPLRDRKEGRSKKGVQSHDVYFYSRQRGLRLLLMLLHYCILHAQEHLWQMPSLGCSIGDQIRMSTEPLTGRKGYDTYNAYVPIHRQLWLCQKYISHWKDLLFAVLLRLLPWRDRRWWVLSSTLGDCNYFSHAFSDVNVSYNHTQPFEFKLKLVTIRIWRDIWEMNDHMLSGIWGVHIDG